MVEEKTYAADRMTGSNENSKGKYKQSYQLFEPMKFEKKMKPQLRGLTNNDTVKI